MTKRKQHAYTVVDGTSVRASDDPKHEHFETWIDYAPGDRVESWPPHADIDDWVASGHWKPVEED